MSATEVILTIVLIVVLGAGLVLAAFLDRARGRRIEHDPDRTERQLRRERQRP